MNRQKTILVPTDFCVASLNTLKLALEQVEEPKVNVVLLYCEYRDDSITELLFYSPSQIIRGLLTDDFRDAVSMLTNRFENKIGQLRVELFHGHAQATFDMLLDTLNVDAIYFSKVYKLRAAKRSFDPTPYIVNGVVPYYEVEWPSQETASEIDKLENLFLN